MSVIFHPRLHHLVARECQVLEVTVVAVVAGAAGVDRIETVDVDPDMVVVDIVEFIAPVGVELDCEEAVGCVAIVVVVDEAQVLGGHSVREVVARGKKKGHAVAAEVELDTVDSKQIGGGKGGSTTAEPKRSRVESMAFEPDGAIGELKQAVLCDCSHTVKGEVCPGEAGIDKLVLPGSKHEKIKKDEEEEM